MHLVEDKKPKESQEKSKKKNWPKNGSKNNFKKKGNSKIQKKKVPYFVCEKLRHLAGEYCYKKGQKSGQVQWANLVEENHHVAVMVDMDDGWWLDSDATCHVCNSS